MKAISLWQPWATLIANGAKMIETRSWHTSHRGLLAIHASATLHPESRQAWRSTQIYARCGNARELEELPRGSLLAVVDMAECVPAESVRFVSPTLSPPWYPIQAGDALTDGGRYTHAARDDQWAFGNFEDGRWAWMFKDVWRLDTPIRCPGRQRVFNVPDSFLKNLTW